jgi:hypothetical protein
VPLMGRLSDCTIATYRLPFLVEKRSQEIGASVWSINLRAECEIDLKSNTSARDRLGRTIIMIVRKILMSLKSNVRAKGVGGIYLSICMYFVIPFIAFRLQFAFACLCFCSKITRVF